MVSYNVLFIFISPVTRACRLIRGNGVFLPVFVSVFLDSRHLCLGLFFGHVESGRGRDTKKIPTLIVTRTTYPKFPPSQLYSSEEAKSDVDAAGPMARMTEATNCAMPLTVPRDARLGAEAVM